MNASPPHRPSVVAIVPAAGRSRRMGVDKQLLDVGGVPMLKRVIASLVASDVDGVVVVTRREIAERLSDDDALGTRDSSGRILFAYNEDAHSEMIDSIRIGMHASRQHTRFDRCAGFLVCPADQPGITAAEFDKCIAAFRQASDQIVIASRGGKRGHPIVFPVALAEFVESRACDDGLNALPRARADRVRTIECASPGVTHDVDTPEDYEKLSPNDRSNS